MTHCDVDRPFWARLTLYLAAAYNLAWGAFVIAAPHTLFEWAGMEPPRYPQIWQCVGMIVGVYGVGYWIAASNPFRHWPIVLVGFLGKILGPIGFIQAAATGALPWKWGATILTNDLIWWLPFAAILYHAFRFHSDRSRDTERIPLTEAIALRRSHRGATLREISAGKPTLVMFLRHTGCTFCREALTELGSKRALIEGAGAEIAIIHMGSPMDATVKFCQYGLDGVHRFSDPHCELYRAFGLKRGTFGQLFGWKVIRRGIAAAWKGHGIGPLEGDGFQMPGVFRLRDGRIEAALRAGTAADRPDYVELATGMKEEELRKASSAPDQLRRHRFAGRFVNAACLAVIRSSGTPGLPDLGKGTRNQPAFRRMDVCLSAGNATLA